MIFQKKSYVRVLGGRIDHAHHDSNAKRSLVDTWALSDAVQKALDMVDIRDTLIIVTADHSHVFTIGGYPTNQVPLLGMTNHLPLLGMINQVLCMTNQALLLCMTMQAPLLCMANQVPLLCITNQLPLVKTKIKYQFLIH